MSRDQIFLELPKNSPHSSAHLCERNDVIGGLHYMTKFAAIHIVYGAISHCLEYFDRKHLLGRCHLGVLVTALSLSVQG